MCCSVSLTNRSVPSKGQNHMTAGSSGRSSKNPDVATSEPGEETHDCSLRLEEKIKNLNFLKI